jgi:sugar/nucleoside kinase (ribokinase family)
LGKFFGAQCDTIYPSESEARAYLGEPELGLPLLASKLFSHDMADAVALTLGARGLVLFERHRQSTDVDGAVRYLPEYLPALSRLAVDPMGAGDALTTVASLARLAGADRVEALTLGSLAAAVVVGRLGNEPVAGEPILRLLERRSPFDES